jgi:hypothetical protein
VKQDGLPSTLSSAPLSDTFRNDRAEHAKIMKFFKPQSNAGGVSAADAKPLRKLARHKTGAMEQKL